MINYNEIVAHADQYRNDRLAQADQRRLTNSFTSTQSHPMIAWVGQQLIRWGKRLQDANQTAATAPIMLPGSAASLHQPG